MDAFASDLDGTLTMGGKFLQAGVIEGLRALGEAGVKLILVTGRCLAEAQEIVGATRFDAMVAENGAVILVGGTKKKVTSEGWIRERARLLPYFGTGCEEVIISSGIEKLEFARERVSVLGRVEVNKDRLMIMPAEVDKGRGLLDALSMLALDPGKTVCMGDGENDVPMFAAAGLTVALGNSVPELRRRADMIMGGSDVEGALEALRVITGMNAGRARLR
jgi:hydroxymethylpyrimidine pyrophosphatase-like HAD family hydrolase